jgi:hypothetical protein
MFEKAIENMLSKKFAGLGAYAPLSISDYNKPYPEWNDDVPFPPGYHQPKFVVFDGTGDPHQHMAHFLS